MSSLNFHNKCLYLLSKKFKNNIKINKSPGVAPIYISINSKLFIEYIISSPTKKINFIGIWHENKLYNGKNMNSFNKFFNYLKQI